MTQAMEPVERPHCGSSRICEQILAIAIDMTTNPNSFIPGLNKFVNQSVARGWDALQSCQLVPEYEKGAILPRSNRLRGLILEHKRAMGSSLFCAAGGVGWSVNWY